MNVVVLAVFGLVLLAGLLTLALGNRGWSWGTVAAAILVLLAATGYLYLSARISERERVWTAAVRKYQADILRERDALVVRKEGPPTRVAADAKSIEELQDQRDRYRRIVERVDTWRGRYWKEASFQPPQPDKADAGGILSIKTDAEDPKTTPLNAGAEVSVFDETKKEDGGAFLGIFRVTEATVDPATKQFSLRVVPDVPPDAFDEKRWTKSYDAVSVYEGLPVDRWLAFHKTRKTPEIVERGGESLPEPEKDDKDVDALLEDLEARDLVIRHGELVAEEDWAKALENEKRRPGTHWAKVEFTADHSPAKPADPGMEPRTFAAGDMGEFDLQTADDLRRDGKVKLLEVRYRRPLADAFTAIRGGKVVADPADGDRWAAGTGAIARMLQGEIAALISANARLESAHTNLENQTTVANDERDGLARDLKLWDRDVAAAERIAAGFEKRLVQVSETLRGVERQIVSLGRELAETNGRLTAAVDRRAPPPRRPGDSP